MSKAIIITLVGVVLALTNITGNQNQRKDNMNKVKIIYVYDAICGWCFGFSPTMAKIKENYKTEIEFDVVSCGIKLGNGVGIIDVVAPDIKTSLQNTDNTCG